MTHMTRQLGDTVTDECPAWCEITDHAEVDGNRGLHASDGQIVRLHHYPFVIPGFDEPDFASLTIGLQADRAALQPYVQLVVDDVREVRLTILEAEELAAGLLGEAGKWRQAEAAEASARRERLASAAGDQK